MKSEQLLGILKRNQKPEGATAGKPVTTQPETETQFLEERRRNNVKNEIKKMEGIKRIADQVPEFLSTIDKCAVNYHALHEDKEKSVQNRITLKRYDELVIKITDAIKSFLKDLKDQELPTELFQVELEADISIISDLCKEAYILDNAFPDFEFLDPERFKEAALKEIYKGSDRAKSAKFKPLGRFSIVGSADIGYVILDQQAHHAVKKEFRKIENLRGDSAVLGLKDFSDDMKYFVFSAETGELSKPHSQTIRPAIGDLWFVRYQDGNDIYILDKNGSTLYGNDLKHKEILNYVPNKNNTKALIQLPRNKDQNRTFNILLGNGKLLFENEGEMQNAYNSSLGNDGQITGGFVFKFEDKFVKVDKDLEIIAEGSSLEEVERAKAA